MKFEIDRERWNCGTGEGSLLNSRGMMCCLGFWSMNKGVNPDDMLDHTTPRHLFLAEVPGANYEAFKDLVGTEDLGYRVNAVGCDLIHINDALDLDNGNREMMIRAKFKEIGDEVVFIGEYPDAP